MARVLVLMGSDSDLPVMKEAAGILDELKISWEAVISSAHRVPEKTAAYARGAAGRGLAVIIAGAGGAAHLPGVIAAYTPLPVIGVPIKTGALNGVDALYAIVQMPSGVPVATVAINAHGTPVSNRPDYRRLSEYAPGLWFIRSWQQVL